MFTVLFLLLQARTLPDYAQAQIASPAFQQPANPVAPAALTAVTIAAGKAAAKAPATEAAPVAPSVI